MKAIFQKKEYSSGKIPEKKEKFRLKSKPLISKLT
jgi:hypothetical protein